jgi:hypothetical protein
MFGVCENSKIRPQIHKVIALKSAHLDRDYHVISKKGNYSRSHLKFSARFGSGDQLGSSQVMQAASMYVLWRYQLRSADRL